MMGSKRCRWFDIESTISCFDRRALNWRCIAYARVGAMMKLCAQSFKLFRGNILVILQEVMFDAWCCCKRGPGAAIYTWCWRSSCHCSLIRCPLSFWRPRLHFELSVFILKSHAPFWAARLHFEPQASCWAAKLHFELPGFILSSQVSFWAPRLHFEVPGFIFSFQVSFWLPKLHVYVPKFILN